jgi:hypothetical protein
LEKGLPVTLADPSRSAVMTYAKAK